MRSKLILGQQFSHIITIRDVKHTLNILHSVRGKNEEKKFLKYFSQIFNQKETFE